MPVFFIAVRNCRCAVRILVNSDGPPIRSSPTRLRMPAGADVISGDDLGCSPYAMSGLPLRTFFGPKFVVCPKFFVDEPGNAWYNVRVLCAVVLYLEVLPIEIRYGVARTSVKEGTTRGAYSARHWGWARTGESVLFERIRPSRRGVAHAARSNRRSGSEDVQCHQRRT